MPNSNVKDAFETLLNALHAELIKIHEEVIKTLEQGNYDIAKDLLKKEIQMETFIAEQRAKWKEWQQMIGAHLFVQPTAQSTDDTKGLDNIRAEVANPDRENSAEIETDEVKPEPSTPYAEDAERLTQSLAEAFSNFTDGSITEENTYREAEVIGQWVQDAISDQTLQRKDQSARKSNVKKKLPRGQCTPQSAYRLPILKALVNLGGEAKAGQVLTHIRTMVKSRLQPVDYETVPSDPRLPRWRNFAMWERAKMKDEGLLRDDSPRGIWAISEKGRRYLQEHEN